MLAFPEHGFFFVIIIHVWCISFPFVIIQPAAVDGSMNIVVSPLFSQYIIVSNGIVVAYGAYAEHSHYMQSNLVRRLSGSLTG